MKTKNSITYHPIGIFHSNYHPKTGAPRQGILYPENRGITTKIILTTRHFFIKFRILLSNSSLLFFKVADNEMFVFCWFNYIYY
jgi:hypothetical protein